MGYHEALIPRHERPAFYKRFVDDSFAYFESRDQCLRFLELLNSLHPSLKFTVEFEDNDQLPFLDVLVSKPVTVPSPSDDMSTPSSIVTSVYRKPTFTGLYIVWDSFCSTLYKINLIRCLVDRAHKICSPSTLPAELDKLKSLFRLNGYPEYIISKYVTTSPPVSPDVGLPKLFLRLPWKGESVAREVKRRVRSVLDSCYLDVSVRFVFTTVRALTVLKDALPTKSQSHLIYLFACRRCGSRYVAGRFSTWNTDQTTCPSSLVK